MSALALRSIGAHKLRVALTALAIALGVAFVAGSFLLTDTIDHAFDRVFAQSTSKYDVAVMPHQAISSATPTPMPGSTLARVRRVEGVQQAVGSVGEQGRIFDKKGKDVAAGYAPDLISSAIPSTFDPLTYVQGRQPAREGEVSLDRHTAQKAGYHLGDTVRVSGTTAVRPYRLVGIARFGSEDSLAGASLAVLTLADAQRTFGLHDSYDEIDVHAADGVSAGELATRLRGALPHALDVRTNSQQAAKQTQDIHDAFLGFLQTLLLVFGAVALFVGSFIIVNTFSITVAQRTREFALLRALGASRRQVLRSVLLEALVLGLVASLLGLALGFALAPGLRALMDAFGASLPSGGIVVEARTPLLALGVGVGVTLLASLGPARRATRTRPVAALVDAALLARPGHSRRRTIGAAALGVLGLVLLGAGVAGDGKLALIGVSALVLFVAAALLAHLTVRPLASLVGRPLERARGVTGRLARENAGRNPRRTASTAAALMVGVGVVGFVTIFAAGIKTSVDRAVDDNVRASVVLQNSGTSAAIPGSASAEVGRLPGVTAAAGVRMARAKVKGGNVDLSGIEPGLSRLYAVDRGRIEGGLTVSEAWADDHGVKAGDRLTLTTPSGTRHTFTVSSVYRDLGGALGSISLPAAVVEREFNARGSAFMFVAATPGTSDTALRDRVKKLVAARYPGTDVYTKAGFKNEQAGQVNQTLGLFYALLSLSVIVSLFGIVTTLALAIHERTRELGMLRALGASRRQVRSMVRWEAVITAIIGAVLGLVLAVGFAAAVSRPLADQGFVFTVPVISLLALLILAGLAGVLAAVWPARRAARIDVLGALAYE